MPVKWYQPNQELKILGVVTVSGPPLLAISD